MRRCTKTSLISVLMMMSAVSANSEDDTFGWYDYIDSRVAHIWTGGEWRSGNSQGQFRLIIMDHSAVGGGNAMFAEWIARDDVNADGSPTIMGASTVAEFDEYGYTQFQLPKCVNPPICNNFKVTARNRQSGELATFELLMIDVGEVSTVKLPSN